MIDGIAAAQWLLNYGSVRPSMCLYYVWQAYAAQGASTSMGAPSAYIAWGDSDGKRPGDRNPPAGAAVWWGRRNRDGNMDGDVTISLGGGRVAVTEPPNQGYVTGSCTLDERENEIDREYLGWTSSIFDCPINVAAGKDYISQEDDMPTIGEIFNTPVTKGPDGNDITLANFMGYAHLWGAQAVWGRPLPHPIAKATDGTPAMVPAGDFLRYEPAEHANTRAVVSKVVTGDIDYDKVAAEIAAKFPTLDPTAFAIAAADEADKRERERLGTAPKA